GGGERVVRADGLYPRGAGRERLGDAQPARDRRWGPPAGTRLRNRRRSDGPAPGGSLPPDVPIRFSGLGPGPLRRTGNLPAAHRSDVDGPDRGRPDVRPRRRSGAGTAVGLSGGPAPRRGAGGERTGSSGTGAAPDDRRAERQATATRGHRARARGPRARGPSSRFGGRAARRRGESGRPP